LVSRVECRTVHLVHTGREWARDFDRADRRTLAIDADDERAAFGGRGHHSADAAR
jgi:hypothetical protein